MIDHTRGRPSRSEYDRGLIHASREMIQRSRELLNGTEPLVRKLIEPSGVRDKLKVP